MRPTNSNVNVLSPNSTPADPFSTADIPIVPPEAARDAARLNATVAALAVLHAGTPLARECWAVASLLLAAPLYADLPQPKHGQALRLPRDLAADIICRLEAIADEGATPISGNTCRAGEWAAYQLAGWREQMERPEDPAAVSAILAAAAATPTGKNLSLTADGSMADPFAYHHPIKLGLFLATIAAETGSASPATVRTALRRVTGQDRLRWHPETVLPGSPSTHALMQYLLPQSLSADMEDDDADDAIDDALSNPHRRRRFQEDQRALIKATSIGDIHHIDRSDDNDDNDSNDGSIEVDIASICCAAVAAWRWRLSASNGPNPTSDTWKLSKPDRDTEAIFRRAVRAGRAMLDWQEELEDLAELEAIRQARSMKASNCGYVPHLHHEESSKGVCPRTRCGCWGIGEEEGHCLYCILLNKRFYRQHIAKQLQGTTTAWVWQGPATAGEKVVRRMQRGPEHGYANIVQAGNNVALFSLAPIADPDARELPIEKVLRLLSEAIRDIPLWPPEGQRRYRPIRLSRPWALNPFEIPQEFRPRFRPLDDAIAALKKELSVLRSDWEIGSWVDEDGKEKRKRIAPDAAAALRECDLLRRLDQVRAERKALMKEARKGHYKVIRKGIDLDVWISILDAIGADYRQDNTPTLTTSGRLDYELPPLFHGDKAAFNQLIEWLDERHVPTAEEVARLMDGLRQRKGKRGREEDCGVSLGGAGSKEDKTNSPPGSASSSAGCRGSPQQRSAIPDDPWRL
jgi:hypothetical protein